MKVKFPTWSGTVAVAGVSVVVGLLIGRTSTGGTEGEDGRSSDSPPPRVTGSRGPAGSDGSRPGREEARASSGLDGDAITELSRILDSNSRLERTQRLLSFLDRLETDQFAAVYADISNSPMANIRGSERSLVLQAWAERDPLAAVDYLQTNPAVDWERETVFSAWATSDPEGAFQTAAATDDEGRINNWVLGAMRGIAATDPLLARDYLSRIEAGETRDRSVRGMQNQVIRYGFDYTESWIAGVNDPDLQNRAARYLADNLAELDPARAAAWSDTLSDTATRREITEIVSGQWARNDMDGAKAWVASLPLETQTGAAEGMVVQYARQNPREAAAWLASLGDGPGFDGARRDLIREGFRADPAGSVEVIATLHDARRRNEAYNRYLREWVRRDADAARDWTAANQAALPQQVVKRILR